MFGALRRCNVWLTFCVDTAVWCYTDASYLLSLFRARWHPCGVMCDPCVVTFNCLQLSAYQC